MFFALPVQNLTLPFLSHFWSFFTLFWPFQASGLPNFGSAPNFNPRRPHGHRSGRSSALPHQLTSLPLVVEGFSPRLSLLFGIPTKLFPVPTGLYSRSPLAAPRGGGVPPGPLPPGPLPHTPGQRGEVGWE